MKYQNRFHKEILKHRRKYKWRKNKPTDVNVVNRQITNGKLNKNEMVDYNIRKHYIIVSYNRTYYVNLLYIIYIRTFLFSVWSFGDHLVD